MEEEHLNLRNSSQQHSYPSLFRKYNTMHRLTPAESGVLSLRTASKVVTLVWHVTVWDQQLPQNVSHRGYLVHPYIVHSTSLVGWMGIYLSRHRFASS